MNPSIRITQKYNHVKNNRKIYLNLFPLLESGSAETAEAVDIQTDTLNCFSCHHERSKTIPKYTVMPEKVEHVL